MTSRTPGRPASRAERSARYLVCEGCGTQLAEWQIEFRLPFFMLERADEAHAMWHLSQERGEPEQEQRSEPA